MTVQKLRARRHGGAKVEFAWEDAGAAGVRIYREGRDPFYIPKWPSDIARVVAFFGIDRKTLEMELDDEWVPLEPEKEK